jgi:hypothetical protein
MDLARSKVLELGESASAGDPEVGPWYFSLNNRRLWVLKRCREEGLLLPSNLVRVRVRQPKSASEVARYTVQNCSLEATLMREPPPTTAPASLLRVNNHERVVSTVRTGEAVRGPLTREGETPNDSVEASDSSSEDGSRDATSSNRYSAFIDS